MENQVTITMLAFSYFWAFTILTAMFIFSLLINKSYVDKLNRSEERRIKKGKYKASISSGIIWLVLYILSILILY